MVLDGLSLDCLFLVDEMCHLDLPPSIHDVAREMDVSECKARLAMTHLLDELYVWFDDDGRFHPNGEFRGRREEPVFVGFFEDEELVEELWS